MISEKRSKQLRIQNKRRNNTSGPKGKPHNGDPINDGNRRKLGNAISIKMKAKWKENGCPAIVSAKDLEFERILSEFSKTKDPEYLSSHLFEKSYRVIGKSKENMRKISGVDQLLDLFDNLNPDTIEVGTNIEKA